MGYATAADDIVSDGITYTGFDCENYESELDCYWGIPYAAPPVGDLRFSPPDAYDWDGETEFEAYGYYSSECAYYYDGELYGDEDCLTLDLYVPTGASGAAVMVWIHGGCFVSGSGKEYYGNDLALDGVIVVSINYRLGVFGFLGAD